MKHALVLALLVAACGKGQTLGNVQPAFAVSGSAHFPLTAFGATATQTLSLESLSAAAVQVGLALSGPQATAFSLSLAATATVPANQTLPLVVSFSPPLPSPIPSAAQTFNATLTLTSNDAAHPTTTVAITGSAQAPELDLCSGQQCLSQGPLTLELGTLAPRQQGGPVQIDLEDLAQVPLTVSQLSLDAQAQAAGYAFQETISPPIVLSGQSGLTQAFELVLNPMASGPAQGHVVVVSDDPRAGGQPVEAALDATVSGAQGPTACLGVLEVDYVDEHSAVADPSQPLSAQPSIVPPGPLDAVIVTAEVSSSCSSDPQDGQNLAYAFALAGPAGSTAALQPVTGHPERGRVQFDLAGNYSFQVTATDSANLTATASLTLPVAPQSDLSASLTWPSPGTADLDLHLVQVLGDAGAAPSLVDNATNDCFWCNCLLASNYTKNSSPCDTTAQSYPTSLQWGLVSSPLAGNPLLVASQRFAPLPSQNLDDVRLVGPQAGATYGLFVHYFQAYQAGPDGGCGSDADCAGDPQFPSCFGDRCVPPASASLRVFVGGQDLFDGGPPLTNALSRPCDLWYAGSVIWLGGGHLADGGYLAPVFAFTPNPLGDAGVTSNGSASSGLSCPTF